MDAREPTFAPEASSCDGTTAGRRSSGWSSFAGIFFGAWSTGGGGRKDVL